MLVPRSLLKRQLHGAKACGLYDLLHAEAARAGLPFAWVLAIGSRETELVNRLGDYRGGEAHGVGVLQIDTQHELARQARDTGTWRSDPAPLVHYGCTMLRDLRQWARAEWPAFSAAQQLKIASSAYNCGTEHAASGAAAGDSDLETTGRDYGRDVCFRFAVFQELLGG